MWVPANQQVMYHLLYAADGSAMCILNLKQRWWKNSDDNTFKLPLMFYELVPQKEKEREVIMLNSI